MKLPTGRRLGDGSGLTRAGDVVVRVIDARITATARDGTAGSGTYRLLTALTDPVRPNRRVSVL